MPNMEKSKYFYPVVEVDGISELDYLDSEILDMDLPTAQTFMIKDPFTYRPDLIAQRFLGSYHYGWLLARHNGFLDPIFDFEQGVVIDIPDMNAYFRFFNKNKVTRRS